MCSELDQLVTKRDLRESIDGLRIELKSDISGLRTELKGDIDDVRTEIRDVKTELKGDIANLSEGLANLSQGLVDMTEHIIGGVRVILEQDRKEVMSANRDEIELLKGRVTKIEKHPNIQLA